MTDESALGLSIWFTGSDLRALRVAHRIGVIQHTW
jgi:hypothetical protein